MTPDLINGIAGYLLVRAPYDPEARALYNAIIVAANQSTEEPEDVDSPRPPE